MQIYTEPSKPEQPSRTQKEFNPCLPCHQKCCYTYLVKPLGYDIWLISTQLQLSPEQFLIWYLVQEPGRYSFKLEHSGEYFETALARRKVPNNEKLCVFWLELPDGFSRCGIYAFRPFDCQNYPAYVSNGVLQLRDDALCPPRSWNLASMDIPRWRLRLQTQQMERNIFSHVVSGWNHLVDESSPETIFSIQSFYGYLLAVYQQLDRLRRNYSKTSKRTIIAQWNKLTDENIDPLAENWTPDKVPLEPIWVEFLLEVRTLLKNLNKQSVAFGHHSKDISE